MKVTTDIILFSLVVVGLFIFTSISKPQQPPIYEQRQIVDRYFGVDSLKDEDVLMKMLEYANVHAVKNRIPFKAMYLSDSLGTVQFEYTPSFTPSNKL